MANMFFTVREGDYKDGKGETQNEPNVLEKSWRYWYEIMISIYFQYIQIGINISKQTDI